MLIKITFRRDDELLLFVQTEADLIAETIESVLNEMRKRDVSLFDLSIHLEAPEPMPAPPPSS